MHIFMCATLTKSYRLKKCEATDVSTQDTGANLSDTVLYRRYRKASAYTAEAQDPDK